MVRVRYEEVKEIWDNKKHNIAIIGQTQYIKYVAGKLGIVRSRHTELKEYYNRYMREQNEYSQYIK